jgi:hypothetical protein
MMKKRIVNAIHRLTYPHENNITLFKKLFKIDAICEYLSFKYNPSCFEHHLCGLFIFLNDFDKVFPYTKGLVADAVVSRNVRENPLFHFFGSTESTDNLEFLYETTLENFATCIKKKKKIVIMPIFFIEDNAHFFTHLLIYRNKSHSIEYFEITQCFDIQTQEQDQVNEIKHTIISDINKFMTASGNTEITNFIDHTKEYINFFKQFLIFFKSIEYKETHDQETKKNISLEIEELSQETILFHFMNHILTFPNKQGTTVFVDFLHFTIFKKQIFSQEYKGMVNNCLTKFQNNEKLFLHTFDQFITKDKKNPHQYDPNISFILFFILKMITFKKYLLLNDPNQLTTKKPEIKRPDIHYLKKIVELYIFKKDYNVGVGKKDTLYEFIKNLSTKYDNYKYNIFHDKIQDNYQQKTIKKSKTKKNVYKRIKYIFKGTSPLHSSNTKKSFSFTKHKKLIH